MSQRGRVTLLVLWLLVLAGLGWMVSQRLKVSTDLRSFMPAPTTADQRLLMAQVGDGAGSRLLLLAISGQPDAKLAALSQGLVAALKKDPRYSQVLNGGFDLGALDPKLLPYRYLLSPTLDTQPLDEAYLADQLQQRLDDLSSPGASLLKDLLPRDPTLEVLKLAERWTPPRSPELREGVMVFAAARGAAGGADRRRRFRSRRAGQGHWRHRAGVSCLARQRRRASGPQRARLLQHGDRRADAASGRVDRAYFHRGFYRAAAAGLSQRELAAVGHATDRQRGPWPASRR